MIYKAIKPKMSLRSFHDLITHTPVGGAHKCELIMASRGDRKAVIKSYAQKRPHKPFAARTGDEPTERRGRATGDRGRLARHCGEMGATATHTPGLGTVSAAGPDAVGQGPQ